MSTRSSYKSIIYYPGKGTTAAYLSEQTSSRLIDISSAPAGALFYEWKQLPLSLLMGDRHISAPCNSGLSLCRLQPIQQQALSALLGRIPSDDRIDLRG